MAKKDWKKHFLRMKQLANQNLGRCVEISCFLECRRPTDEQLLMLFINGMNGMLDGFL